MPDDESEIPEAVIDHLRDALKEATAARVALAPIASLAATAAFMSCDHACTCITRALDEVET
ncbi:MAG TPA: hypothetical protein VM389_12950 [Phycisphaerae bacterium]|nr:hypothetical protein [Phycisphaerae bacterium]